MKKLFTILLYIIVSILEMVGQTTIKGTVTNSPGGTPIAGVKVSTGGLPPSISITRSDGQYLIVLQGKTNELKFSKKGYRTRTVAVSGRFIDVVLENIEDKENRIVTGRVTSLSDGIPVKNAKITPIGSGLLHTFTDDEGWFKLKIPVKVKSLKVISVNMKTNFVSILSDSIDIILVPGNTIEGKSADIGYGLKENMISSSSLKQVVSNEKLNSAYQTNINNLLAGKVSGLKVYGQSDMALGRTGTIGLRGQGGLSTGQSPVYLVDGTYLSDINDIDYNEIESVSILYGPASSALLGSVAANGAVLITTRKAESHVGKSGIEINSGIMFSQVYITPQYQNSYAGGYADDMYKYTYRPGIDPVEWQTLDGKYYHDYGDDASWGPEMAGQEYIPWYSWYPGTKYTGTTSKLVPQPDNVKDFYNTGLRITNSFAFSESTKDLSVRAVFGNSDIKGTLPFSSLKKNSFTLKTKYEPAGRLTIEADIKFFTTLQKGEINDDYSNQTTGSFNSWFHRDLDMLKMKELTDLRSPQNYLASWNHNNTASYDPSSPISFYSGNYWINPYKYLKSINLTDRTDRLYGKVSISYKLADGLNADVTYRRQQSSGWAETKVPVLYYTSTQSNGRTDYYYSTGTDYSNQENLNALLLFKRDISDFHLDIVSGLDLSETIVKANNARTTEGLNIPDLYTIQNSRGTPIISNTRTNEKSRSVFAHSVLGYKNLLFIDMTFRNEWLSTLPPNHNSINIKSIGGVFVFSELISLPLINSGRIRYSWGETPTGLKAYQYPGLNYSYKYNYYNYLDGLPFMNWNGIYVMETPDYMVIPEIKGAVKRQSELGIEIELFKSRAGFSLTYWQGKEFGIPQIIQIPGYSGFTSRLINSGRIDKNGLDFTSSFTSFSSENLSMQTCFVFSKLINQRVVSIGGDITKISTQSVWYSQTPSLTMTAGRQWGELYGSGKKMINGKPVLDANGYYIADPDKYFGSVIPDITGGFQNELHLFKDFSINIGIDYQFGGKFFSLSDMWGTFSGLTARTAILNDKGKPVRDPVANGGGVHVSGVNAAGNDVDYYIEGQDYFHGLYNSRVFDDFVYSASYIKLRELNLSYKIPLKKLKTEKFNPNVTISIYAQNLWMIYAAQKNFDPSELSYISGEQAQFPSVRSFGTNLKISF